MKIALLSESPADESAVRILAQSILGQAIDRPAPAFPLRARGWPSVLNVLPAVIKHFHFRTDAEALIVVADSNHSTPHRGAADEACGEAKCRLCKLRQAAEQTLQHLRDVPGRDKLRVAVGLAMPAIEAWYLCGRRKVPTSEIAWIQGRESGNDPYTRNQLKKDLYGTDRPALSMLTKHAIVEAERLAENIDLLEERFPLGFGALARAVRSWT